jgi:hypothetical protein
MRPSVLYRRQARRSASASCPQALLGASTQRRSGSDARTRDLAVRGVAPRSPPLAFSRSVAVTARTSSSLTASSMTARSSFARFSLPGPGEQPG